MKLNTEAEFSNMNVRAEKAGEDVGEGACDLTIAAILPIDEIAPLFGDPKATQALLEAIYSGENPIPNLQRLDWNREINAIRVQLDPEFEDPVILEGCSLDKIKLAPDHSQYLSIRFRIQGHPTAEQVGGLYEMQGRTVQLSLNSTQADMFDDDDEPAEGQATGAEGALE